MIMPGIMCKFDFSPSKYLAENGLFVIRRWKNYLPAIRLCKYYANNKWLGS